MDKQKPSTTNRNPQRINNEVVRLSTPDGLKQIESRLEELRLGAGKAQRERRLLDYHNIVDAGKRLKDIAKKSAEAKRVNGFKCVACSSDRMFEFVGDWPGNHYSKIACGDCGKFKDWGKKPKSKKRKRSTKGHANLLKVHGQGFCEMCLRSEADLNIKHGLEIHHVIEHADGGGDERGNIWIVCKHCHSQIHLSRTYLACKALKRAGEAA